LNNFCGYPHKRWHELSEQIGAGSEQVLAALARWRGQDPPADPRLRYFNWLE
jgi:hypothetical protein